MKYILSTIFILPFLLGNALQPTPAFFEIQDPKVRKKAFIEFLVPQVNAINEQILQERSRLVSLFEKRKKNEELSWLDEKWLKEVSQAHRMTDFNVTQLKHWEELLLRVDVIPASLVLAQAANESGWGTSRFAVLGNNYFGQYCTKPGCGIQPLSARGSNLPEVQKFGSVFQSIRSYFRNLNSHRAYAKVRQIRAKMRKTDQPLDGMLLADGLEQYSTRGQAYIQDLKKMIRSDSFEKMAIKL
jgi:Bax protein